MIVGCAGGFYLPRLPAHSLGAGPCSTRATAAFAVLAAAADFNAFDPGAEVEHAACAARGDRPPARLRRRCLARWSRRQVLRGPAASCRVIRSFARPDPEALPFSILGLLPRAAVPRARRRAVLVADHRADPHRARDVRLLHEGEGVARRDRADAHPCAREPRTSTRPGTRSGSRCTPQYMGEEMHFGPARMERLRFAALMHDIGKLVVPNHLLEQAGQAHRGRVRPDQDRTRRSRVQMLSHIEFLRPIAGVAPQRQHALRPRRPRPPDRAVHRDDRRRVRRDDLHPLLPQGAATRGRLQELRDKAGIQFHPACVEALIAAIETRGEKHGAGYEVHAEFEDAPEAGFGSAGLGDLLPAEA